ncbi:DUF4349 domain-containing protein [Flavivirga jejuensis]|uniref:DUF4349 domain-containing protein n=1 Tax=Flavivirga jejuensis TaxID=870487 RepID=A0ABT8WPF9_9FLAO|nr:DUF4349 domain-containing protein [Flavivirga jejuensis]MDO5975063.1 DUF4349 domain-containing protein [Flavivirga jejuensis]
MKANQLKIVFKILAVSLIFVSFLACSQSSKYNESVPVTHVEINEDFESVNDETSNFVLKQDASINAVPKHLKIIKSANAKYKVKDVKKATNQIKNMVHKYGAYISDLRFDNNLYKKENRFTIKVPEQYFDSMIDSISTFVEFIDYENITTQDVTEEYIDIQTRLKTKLEVKARYESILRKNAKTVEDILATEDKLRIIQEEIEAAQGRLKYLTNKVSYSTIQIDLYETVDYKEEPNTYNKTFWSKIKEGISFGWDFIESLVIGIIHIWPLLIIGILTFIFIKKRLRHKK